MRTAVAQALPVDLGTADAFNEFRRHLPKTRVFNAAPEWFSTEYDGNPYHFPPHLPLAEPGPNGEMFEMVEHPVEIERDPRTGEPVLDDELNFRPRMVPADGIMLVGDLFGHVYDRFGQNQGQDLIPGNQAVYIVIFMQRSHGERGIVWLRGDAKDETRKKMAFLLWKQHKRQWALDQVASFQRTLANWRATGQDKTSPAPRPNSAQNLAQEFLDHYLEESRPDEFTCKECLGYTTTSWDKFAFHMMKRHKVAADKKNYAAIGDLVKRAPRASKDDEDLDRRDEADAAAALVSLPKVKTASKKKAKR